MSNVLMGIVGLVLAIGLAIAGALYFGDRFSASWSEAEATRYISEGAQIAQAYELFLINEGRLPDAEADAINGWTSSDAKIMQLKNMGYLKDVPLGGNQHGDHTQAWHLDETHGAVLTYIGENDQSRRICVRARMQAGMFEPEQIKQCSASDLETNDPCCIG